MICPVFLGFFDDLLWRKNPEKSIDLLGKTMVYFKHILHSIRSPASRPVLAGGQWKKAFVRTEGLLF
jgi:hypothetical protein